MAARRETQPAEASALIRVPGALEAVAFAILAVVAAMRPMLTETYDSALTGIDRAIGQADSVTPALTAGLDMTIWLAVAMATTSWAIRKWRWRFTGIALGTLLMTAGAVLSTCYAGNKRLALNASFDWLTALAMLIALANLCRTRLRVVILLAGIAASGLATSARCVVWKYVELPDTIAMYEQERETIWTSQGIQLDDPRVELFERRLRGGEAAGFFPHSNIAGSWLMLIGLASLGLADMSGHRGLRIALRLLAMILLASIWMTGSRGAMMAAGAGLAMYAVIRLIEPWLRQHGRKALIIGWAVAILGVGAVVGHGVYRNGLPGQSLTYRWNYWQVTSQIIAESPVTGTGALNLGPAYLERKPVRFPEEIKDPHNALMAITSQWGVFGGLGFLAALVMGSVAALKQITTDNRADPELPRSDSGEKSDAVRWVVGLSVFFVLSRLVILDDITPVNPAKTAVLFFDIALYGLVWIVTFSGIALALTRLGQIQGERVRIACLCAIAAFMLHNMISFSLFYPGTLTAFVAIGGLLLRQREELGPAASDSSRRYYPGLIAMLGLAACWWWVDLPVGSAQQHLRGPRTVFRNPLPPEHFAELCLPSYVQAAQADRYDPTPLTEAARGLCVPPEETYLRRALQLLSLARERDPEDLGIVQFRRRVESELYKLTQDPADLQAAIATARKAVLLYPSSPDEHLALADLLAQAAESHLSEQDADWDAAALKTYRRALDLNDARPADEIRRWPQRVRSRVVARIEGLATRAAD